VDGRDKPGTTTTSDETLSFVFLDEVLAIILPFHRLIARTMLRQVAA